MEYGVGTLDGSERSWSIPIRRELVQLTGNWLHAIVLNQMIYWTERLHDVEDFLHEERSWYRACHDNCNYTGPSRRTHGWVSKSGSALADELLTGHTGTHLRRVLKDLVAAGFLEERNNPQDSRDRALQYRPQYVNIQLGLRKLGYAPPPYMRPVVDGVNTVPSLDVLPESREEVTEAKEQPKRVQTAPVATKPVVQPKAEPKPAESKKEPKKSPKKQQRKKASPNRGPQYYGPEHYEKITPEEWAAAVERGEMPGRETPISLVLGYYVLAMYKRRGTKILLKGSDMSGRYGKGVKELLDYFEALEGPEKALESALAYVDWWVDSEDPWVANEVMWSPSVMLSTSQYRDKYGQRDVPKVKTKDWTKGALGNSRSTKTYTEDNIHEVRAERF